MECRQESIGWREGGGISKGPRDGNRTWVTVSTVVLYVGALTTRLSASTQNIAFVRMYTFRIKSTESLINETPGLVWCCSG